MERALLCKISSHVSGYNPLTITACKAFLAGGLGDAYASKRLSELILRARKARKTLYEYLKDLRERGELERAKRGTKARPIRLNLSTSPLQPVLLERFKR